MSCKVTVCELPNTRDALSHYWDGLKAHVKAESSDLLLLPEMPFSRWFPEHRPSNSDDWAEALRLHTEWEERIGELGIPFVAWTRPVEKDGRRYNQAVVWDSESGTRAVHTKSYLPDEEGYWEASWYQAGQGTFRAFRCGKAHVGFAICTDLWFFQHARNYGKQGIQLLCVPRATPRSTLEKWLTGGRAAAVVSGAFCLSSNRVHPEGAGPDHGGMGWIIDPDGDVLGRTSPGRPFLSLALDLREADLAKSTYPRYIRDMMKGGRNGGGK